MPATRSVQFEDTHGKAKSKAKSPAATSQTKPARNKSGGSVASDEAAVLRRPPKLSEKLADSFSNCHILSKEHCLTDSLLS